MHRWVLSSAVAAVVAVVLPVAPSAQRDQGERLTVYAAASLTDVFRAVDSRPQYEFAGSDQLAFQIQQGAPADVFAAASPKYTTLLDQKGLVQKPIPFATNMLVLVVPKSNPANIHSVLDLTKSGVKVVIGDPGVPVGAYTRTVLNNLGITDAVMKNVVSQEPDVRGVLGKVALGQADAGFVYITDARTVKGKVGVILIRASAQPQVVYEVAVVKNSRNLAAAYRFVTRLIRAPAQRELRKYGFGLRPKPAK
jgi:molybdate transport system substrate-binding protein